MRVLLSGKGFSGRGVECKLLTADQVDAVDNALNALLEPGDTAFTARIKQLKLGAQSMIRRVTEKGGLKSDDEMNAAKWVDVDVESLGADWAKYFNAKDTQLLRSIYEKNHGVSNAEVEGVLGKALMTSDD
jgi:hypothetical protein